MYAGTLYFLNEKQFNFLPGVTFEQIVLSIGTYYGDWYIDFIEVCEEHPGKKTCCFLEGDWLFDEMVKEIYADGALMDDISLKSRQEWLEGAR
jgi:hypothetical protein